MSLADYARHRGCARATVTQAIDAGKLPRSVGIVDGKRRILDRDRADREWIENSRRPHTRTAATPTTASPVAWGTGLVLGDTLADAQKALTHERTRKAWLENQQREGELIPRAAVAKDAFESTRIIREGLLNLPSRISGALAAESNQAKVAMLLDAAIRECLMTLADKLQAPCTTQTPAPDDYTDRTT
jgi:hypothetical protein